LAIGGRSGNSSVARRSIGTLEPETVSRSRPSNTQGCLDSGDADKGIAFSGRFIEESWPRLNDGSSLVKEEPTMPLSDVNVAPTLVYRVVFPTGNFEWPVTPRVDNTPGQHGVLQLLTNQPAEGKIERTLGTHGLRLRLTRDDPAAGSAHFLFGLDSLPPDMWRFRVSAGFRLDLSDTRYDPAGIWAPVVIACDASTGDAIPPTATLAGATHQVRLCDDKVTPCVTLGAGNPTPQPSPKSVKASATAVYDDLGEHAFTLGAYFDRITGDGQSELTTSSGYHWENRWTHRFTKDPLTLNPLKPAPAPLPLGFVGFGLSIPGTQPKDSPSAPDIPNGVGTATIVVTEFSLVVWAKATPLSDDSHPIDS